MNGESVQSFNKWGTEFWKLPDGKLHRLDGPSVRHRHGGEHWHQHGKLHRLDGPALIDNCGNQFWFQHDSYHRDDGPAEIYTDGALGWFQHGIRHRLDGPAFISGFGKEQWFIDQIDISIQVHNWIRENELSPWELWDDDIWTLFRLRFQ